MFVLRRPWLSLLPVACVTTALTACGGATPAAEHRTTARKSVPSSANPQAARVARVDVSTPVDPQPHSEKVALRFGWPHGASMSVRVTQQRQHDREQARSTITYKVGVAQIERGRRISYSAYMPYLDVPGALATDQHGMRGRLAELVPALITDEHGEFMALPELARSSKERRLKALGVKGRRNQRLAAKAISNDALTTAARHFWDQRVGRWRSEVELVRGEEYEEPDVLPVPELGGATVDAVTRYSFVDWAKCSEDARDARCVELHLETTPRAESMAKAVLAFKKAHGRFGRARVILNVEKTTRVEIVTEPGTLRPRRFKEDRFTMLGLRDRRGNETQSMTTDSQLEVYNYD